MLVLSFMIKGEKIKKRLAQNELTIGPTNTSVDLPLPLDGLKKPHLKIVRTETDYQVINLAHDPYVLLNKLPFGKRPLHEGDHLLIREMEIVVEKEVPVPQPKPAQARVEKIPTPPRQVRRRASAWVWLGTAFLACSATFALYALIQYPPLLSETKEIAELEHPPDNVLPPPGLSGY